MELCIPSLGSDPVFALARRAESSRFGGRMDDDDFLTSSASTMETPSLEEERRLEEPASDWSAVREDDDPPPGLSSKLEERGDLFGDVLPKSTLIAAAMDSASERDMEPILRGLPLGDSRGCIDDASDRPSASVSAAVANEPRSEPRGDGGGFKLRDEDIMSIVEPRFLPFSRFLSSSFPRSSG